jgi:hypothetical protein
MWIDGQNDVPLADLNGAQLPGPRIHAPEDLPVERLQVREVVTAGQRLGVQDGELHGGDVRFGFGELGCVGDAEAVSEDAIGLAVGVGHSAALRV